ncbi:alternate-type signal peptide domain-containing protein [Rhodococcus hoagii]|uniref:Alternate-type signal peptide domain-containing protein n=1 Tax=Rhodococcus hoagii TaxID=43767 RepID=A0AAE2W486_RHOHA|nr:alternate-type signal peptide domain-containing protein [Prescottella equi]MBM4510156.1 alternate-type signal peptide domain-containing protein [Prescottella equi]MBM4510163.1 alternate-type signal peptide domain-containing protein [Prescottella equi]MBM4510283.1 alternate-type signal peptide domain-containing protein [Prescottella equi]MBM4539363.1 alternate-type signal peptide domain-containing protein [Prescottella equi]
MKTRTKGVVAAAALCSAFLLTACDPIGTGSAGSAAGGTTTSPSGPTTTAPPTTIGGGGNGSGSLSLTALAQPTWSDQNGPIDISTMRIVPGDVLTYRGTFTIALQGNGLRARITTDNVTFTGGGQLKGKLQPQVTATIDGAPLPAGNIVTTAQNGATVEVAAKFTFDPQTAGAVGQSDTANFQNIGVHLEQVIG